MTGETSATDTMSQRSSRGGINIGQIIMTFVPVFLVYLLLTAASGDILWWSFQELVAGVILSFLAAFFGARFLYLDAGENEGASPGKLFLLIPFLFGPFLVGVLKANLDVAYRVIKGTSSINPGIVRIRPGLKTDLGITILANSITLTPGTLTVDIDEKTNDLYVHWINVDEAQLNLEENSCEIEPVCGSFAKWAGRIAE